MDGDIFPQFGVLGTGIIKFFSLGWENYEHKSFHFPDQETLSFQKEQEAGGTETSEKCSTLHWSCHGRNRIFRQGSD